MRLKHIKNADVIISNCKYVVNNPLDYKGKWKQLFSNDNDIEIEIGTGKGKFIISKAIENPNINYIGIEKYDSLFKNNKVIEMKTDNDGLFENSRESFLEYGYEIKDENTNYFDKFTTEYEDKFISLGKNINYIRVEKE